MHVWGPRMKRRQTETAPKGFCCPHETDRVAHHQAGRGGERLGWHSWQALHKRVHAVSCSQRKTDSAKNIPVQLMQTKAHVRLFKNRLPESPLTRPNGLVTIRRGVI